MALITDKLHAMMVKSGWFRLVARDDMEKLLAEHNVQMSDVCDSTAQAVEYGKILSANQIIIGTVGRLGQTYQVVLKQVNVESGEIEHVGQAEGRGGAEILLRLVKLAAADLLKREAPVATTVAAAAAPAASSASDKTESETTIRQEESAGGTQ
jgi:curli biogenesis system outer membrane secretion channel CsgG